MNEKAGKPVVASLLIPCRASCEPLYHSRRFFIFFGRTIYRLQALNNRVHMYLQVHIVIDFSGAPLIG